MTEYPGTLEGCYELIDELRERLSGYEARDEALIGFTPCEARIYGMLRRNSFVSWKALLSALYGLDAPPSRKSISVMTTRIRRKLPPGEQIISVWGQGYRLERAH